MPIHQSMWQISGQVKEISNAKLGSEMELENVLQKNIEILNANWLVIGRQVLTGFNKYIDLLAIDITGSIIILELKKDKTPRDVVAQSIDYASWIKSVTPEELSDIFEAFDKKYLHSGKSLDETYYSRFNVKLEEENLNSSHQIVIVAAELDSSTERIINYLNESNVPINTVFFNVYNLADQTYLSRAWLIDPYETADIATVRDNKEPWNGEYYISFGEGEDRNWDDARKYGFISAGGGLWYSRTLNLLKPGNRIWVNLPGAGYVGVGIVADTARKADEVVLTHDGKEHVIYDLPNNASYHKRYINDEDMSEYIVKVDWIKTVTREVAISEVGFFGNQNSACKPTVGKWNHTIDRLKSVWGIE